MGVHYPGVQRLTRIEDLDKIEFVNDMAAVEVPIELLDKLPLKNDNRGESPRLEFVEQSIRDKGYNNLNPVICRIGRRGRWVVVDGGHRLTAARIVSREFFTNLFGDKVRNIYFLLFRTPLTNSRIGEPDDDDLPDFKFHPAA